MSCTRHSAGELAARPVKAPPVAASQPEIAECPPTGFPGPYTGIAISAASASDGDAIAAGGGADGVAPSHCGLSETFAAPFWSRVDRSAGVAACWPWVASRGRPGYCRAWAELRGRRVRVDAHRRVQRRCKSCCNPVHLQSGTSRQNIRPALRNGLAVRCMSRRHALAVFRARRRRALEVEIVGKLGVSRSTGRGVLLGKSWRVVTGIRPHPLPQSIGKQLAMSLREAGR